MVLAGGFGTRVAALRPEVPKPMIEVGGRPFLAWVIDWLASAGLRRFVISTGHLAEVIERYFAAAPRDGRTIACVRESAPLGTAGAVAECRAQSAPARVWVVANGDSIVLAELSAAVARWQAGGMDALVVGVRVADTGRFGSLEIDADGWLRGFHEKRPGAGVINAGVYLLSDAVVRGFDSRRPLSLERDVFPALVSAGRRIGVHETDAPFLDIGTPESLAAAEAFARAHLRGKERA